MSVTTAATGTERARTLRSRLRRRWPAFVLATTVLLVATWMVVNALASQTNQGSNDPIGVGPNGSGALAAVLSRNGVDLHRTILWSDTQTQLRPGTTLFITRTSFLPAPILETVARSGARVVLLNPGEELTKLSDEVKPDSYQGAQQLEAACTLPEVAGAPRINAAANTYAVTTGGISCYQGAYASGHFLQSLGGNEFRVIGSGEILWNKTIPNPGNAALAIAALGTDRTLIWWLPSPDDPSFVNTSGQPVDPLSLLPAWVRPVSLLLILSVLPLGFWRGRRLGRLVPEPLPVVVRSVETAEGRATLYRRAGESRRALQVLRAAALRRTGSRLGYGTGAPVSEIVDAWADAVHRPTDELRHLLTADPGQNPALHEYVSRIDALESGLRSATPAASTSCDPSHPATEPSAPPSNPPAHDQQPGSHA